MGPSSPWVLEGGFRAFSRRFDTNPRSAKMHRLRQGHVCIANMAVSSLSHPGIPGQSADCGCARQDQHGHVVTRGQDSRRLSHMYMREAFWRVAWRPWSYIRACPQDCEHARERQCSCTHEIRRSTHTRSPHHIHGSSSHSEYVSSQQHSYTHAYAQDCGYVAHRPRAQYTQSESHQFNHGLLTAKVRDRHNTPPQSGIRSRGSGRAFRVLYRLTGQRQHRCGGGRALAFYWRESGSKWRDFVEEAPFGAVGV